MVAYIYNLNEVLLLTLATNKKAFHEYEILEKIEVGVVLQGTEVKSVKANKINLKESYVKVINGEVLLLGCHISTYEFGNRFNHDPLRNKKLLLHRKEINKLIGRVNEKGLALMVTRIYLKKGLVKAELAVAKGKKLYDKRASLKEKDLNREMAREFKNSNN